MLWRDACRQRDRGKASEMSLTSMHINNPFCRLARHTHGPEAGEETSCYRRRCGERERPGPARGAAPPVVSRTSGGCRRGSSAAS
jgi:hypothetical protein